MFDTARLLDCAGRALKLDRPRIMGIVNVTPDSFSGDGRPAADAAIERGLELAADGADLLDVGGESTRPGAGEISVDEEIARVVPVIEALAARTGLPISVDTSRAAVMRAAVAAGAGMLNDVYALRREGAMAAAAELGVPVVLMHMLGEPRTMQDDPRYDDVVGEVHRFLGERLFAAQLAGIEPRRILVDPGFGFGKTLEHNLELLRSLRRFVELAPVVAGLSRKATIGALTGRASGAARAAGSAAAALLAVQNGAALVRVHDVAMTRDVLAVWERTGPATSPQSSARAGSARLPWDDVD